VCGGPSARCSSVVRSPYSVPTHVAGKPSGHSSTVADDTGGARDACINTHACENGDGQKVGLKKCYIMQAASSSFFLFFSHMAT
jgi:hypothetical protein